MIYRQRFELPYSFDLIYDIKTVAELEKRLGELKNELNDLNDLCKSHNIKITEKVVDNKIFIIVEK